MTWGIMWCLLAYTEDKIITILKKIIFVLMNAQL
jgi:hypothetical protein